MRASCLAKTLLISTFAIGCGDDHVTDPGETPLGPGPSFPSFAISDAVHDAGNQHFFWLQPMVETPESFNGPFDGAQSPTVRICDLADCGVPIVEYTMSSGSGSEVVRVETGSEHYVVNWHTDEFDVGPGPTYRISVIAEATELGYADIQLTETGKEAKNLTTNELIGLKDGRTLPIKFRIEEGATGFRFVTVDAGERQTCALGNDGNAYCWGDHAFGQSGTGLPRGQHVSPQLVVGGHAFAEVRAADGEFSCGVTTAGTALCWGRDNEGQLGSNEPVQSCGGGRLCVEFPVAVAGGLSWLSVAPGGQSLNCGLDAAGAAYCWGLNAGGGLGDAAGTSQSDVPLAVAGGLTFAAIAAGGIHACAITTANEMYCWGGSRFGEGGWGTMDAFATPTPVLGGHEFVSVSATGQSTCGITTTQDAYCWGQNNFGQVGDGTSGDYKLAPTAVSGGHKFMAITNGNINQTVTGHTCGITTSGEALCWGRNDLGQLGDGSVVDRPVPTPVSGGLTFAWISAGVQHTCGVTTSGDVYCWGGNVAGGLGNGTSDSDPHPLPELVVPPM